MVGNVMNNPSRLAARLVATLAALLVGFFLVSGCTPKPPPEPTETKEERRLKEKEIMHREMRNE